MKQDNINYLAVGGFVLGMLVLLIASLLYISGQGDATDIYHVSYTDIAGIHDGTTVTYGGYKIGKIESVEPLRAEGETRYHVTLAIRAGWQIPDDSTAQIVSPGILAEKTIEIHEGDSRRMLRPGDTIRGLPAVDMMAMMNRLSGEFEELADGDIRPLIQRLGRHLNGIGDALDRDIPRITESTRTLLDRLNASAEQLNGLLDKNNRQHLSSLFRNANEMSVSLKQLTQRLNETGDKVDHLLNQSHKLLDDNDADIRQAVLDMRRSLDILARNMNAIVHNLASSSRNMNEFTRELRRNPSTLINSKPPADNKE